MAGMGRRMFFCGCAVLTAPCLAFGQSAPKSAGPADAGLIEDLVAGNRILFDQGVVDGFGHISARHDKDPARFLLSRSMAPALVTADDIMEFDLDGNPVDARGRAVYLERFIHGEIYRLRPEVTSVVHSHSPAVIPFGVSHVALQPIYHMSSFLGAGVPVFDIRDAGGPATDMLIRTPALGHALAVTMGDHPVMLMRGHGSVVAATAAGQAGVRQAVFRSVYTEQNARMEAEALRLGEVTFLNAEESAAATTTNAGLVNRPWEMWKRQAQEKAGR